MAFSPQIAVIADDLTGALDSVVVFANAGLRCVVATSPAHLSQALLQQPQVVALSTNSRALAPNEAARVVASATQMLHAVPICFKKIDSRLKGNIAAEVAALAGVRGSRDALICPAIPQMGRTVAHGLLQGFGVAQPEPVAPILADVPGLSVTAPDAATDADLDALLPADLHGTLLIGARGLAAALARRVQPLPREPVTLSLPGPIAFVIGSRDPITLAQVRHLQHSHPGARFIAAPNGQTLAPPAPADVTILQVLPGTQLVDPLTVTQDLARSCWRSLTPLPACLVLTGGETAAAVLTEIGLGVLQVVGEVLPGIPLCKACGGDDLPLIVTKSGGFGAPDALSLLAGSPHPTKRHPVEQV